MKFNESIPVFGDVSFRGGCKSEYCEQVDFYAWLKLNYPEYHSLFLHPKTEGQRTYQQVNYEKRAGGIPKSLPDLMIINNYPFCVELKKKNHVKSQWQNGQQEKLIELKNAGCFIGVALGADGAKEAFLQWLEIIEKGA